MLSTRLSCQISIKLEFPQHIFENPQILKFMKTLPVGAELFHGDGTDREKT